MNTALIGTAFQVAALVLIVIAVAATWGAVAGIAAAGVALALVGTVLQMPRKG